MNCRGGFLDLTQAAALKNTKELCSHLETHWHFYKTLADDTRILMNAQSFKDFKPVHVLPWVELAIKQMDMQTNLKNECKVMGEDYSTAIKIIARACFLSDSECSDLVTEILKKCSSGD
jgi:hypothetical protein